MTNQILIGKIVKAIGLKGEIKVLPQTDDISRFKKLESFFIGANEYKVEKVSVRDNFAVLKLASFDTIESVENLINKEIFIDRQDAVKLKQNQFFIVDLINCELKDKNDKIIGKIIDIENYGASDILVFKNNGKEFRAPFIENLFDKIDLENSLLVVNEKFMEVIV